MKDRFGIPIKVGNTVLFEGQYVLKLKEIRPSPRDGQGVLTSVFIENGVLAATVNETADNSNTEAEKDFEVLPNDPELREQVLMIRRLEFQ